MIIRLQNYLTFLMLSFLIIGCQNQEKGKNRESFGSNQDSIDYSSVDAEIARNYYNSNNYLSAFKAYNSLIERDSTSGEYYYNRGICYMEFYNFDLAINNFETAIKLGYRIADANFNISISYISQQNDSMALVFMNEYNQLEPNDSVGVMLSRGFLEIGRLKNNKTIDEDN